MNSIIIITFDRHAATTVAAVLLPIRWRRFRASEDVVLDAINDNVRDVPRP